MGFKTIYRNITGNNEALLRRTPVNRKAADNLSSSLDINLKIESDEFVGNIIVSNNNENLKGEGQLINKNNNEIMEIIVDCNISKSDLRVFKKPATEMEEAREIFHVHNNMWDAIPHMLHNDDATVHLLGERYDDPRNMHKVITIEISSNAVNTTHINPNNNMGTIEDDIALSQQLYFEEHDSLATLVSNHLI